MVEEEEGGALLTHRDRRAVWRSVVFAHRGILLAFSAKRPAQAARITVPAALCACLAALGQIPPAAAASGDRRSGGTVVRRVLTYRLAIGNMRRALERLRAGAARSVKVAQGIVERIDRLRAQRLRRLRDLGRPEEEQRALADVKVGEVICTQHTLKRPRNSGDAKERLAGV